MRRPPDEIAALYDGADYLDAYVRHTDRRVARDPHKAVGGEWERLGRLQFDFLVAEGLAPYHRLLDIGCGTLRGGRHFIRHLEAGNYTGTDISPAALAYAARLVEAEGLVGKRPRLLLSSTRRLDFAELVGESFDFLLAQSVFTHLPPEPIEACFRHLRRVMHRRSVFYFTFWPAEAHARTGHKTFRQPPAFFAELARRHGFRLEDRAHAYPHPRGQRMLRLVPLAAPRRDGSAAHDPRWPTREDGFAGAGAGADASPVRLRR
jgi:SAM-dependent methyltransferase